MENKNEIISKWSSKFDRFLRRLDSYEYEGEELDIANHLGDMENDFFVKFNEDESIPEKELNFLIYYFKESGHSG